MRWKILLLIALGVLSAAAQVSAEAPADTETEEGEEMVVTATRMPVHVSEAPGSVHVITEDQLAENPGHRDLAELLSYHLGVQVNSSGYGGAVSSVSLRGAGSEQVLVLLNGIPLVNPQIGMASLSFIPLDVIDRIEVVQGPLSALYGEDAMGGVINIMTKDDWQGHRLNLGGGSYESGSLQYSHAWQWGSFHLGAASSDGYRPNNEYEANWQVLNLRPKLGNWELDLGFYRYKDDKGVPGSITYPSLTAQEEDGQRILYLTARKNHKGGETLFRVYEVVTDSFYRDEFSLGDHEAYRRGLEAQSAWELCKGLELVAVGKWERTGVDSNTVGEQDRTAESLAFQLAWQPREKLKVYGGDLWAHSSDYGANHSPRLGVVYQAKPGLVLKTMYAEAFRVPTLNELYWPEDPWSRGNPNLRPETAKTWEAGLEYQYLDRLLAKVTCYRTSVVDLIEWRPEDDGDGDPWNVPWSPQNFGRVRMKGVDLGLTWRLNQQWSTGLQLHYLDAKELNEVTGNYDTKLDTRTPLSAAWHLKYSGERWGYAMFTRYFDGYGDVGTSVILDLLCTYKIKTGWTVRLGVNNALDRDYEFSAGYPMPGRNFRLEMDLKFQ